MHRPFHILFAVTIQTALLAGLLSAQDELQSPVQLPLLPQVHLPSELTPPQPCFTCNDGSDRLKLLEKHTVVHRIPLDTYWPELTGDLLTIERGFNRKWDPAFQYMVYPRGLQDSENTTLPAVVLAHEAILFEAKQKADGTVVFLPKSHPDASMRRDGNELVVERRNKGTWHFQSFDGGHSWQLSKMESARHPGKVVTLSYSGNQITEILYPDGARVVLEYDGDLVDRIILPSGLYARVNRDELGWIDAVGIFHPDHEVKKEVLHVMESRTSSGWEKKVWWRDANKEPGTFLYGFKYENDADGRITRFENACGSSYTVAYTHAQIENHELFTVIERSETDGFYRFMRHRDYGRIWFQEYGVGSANTPLDQATISETVSRQRVKYNWQLTNRWDFKSGLPMPAPDQVYCPPPKKSPLAAATSPDQASADTQNAEQFTPAPPSVEKLEDGKTATTLPDASGNNWRYETGDADQILACIRPDGRRLEWDYDRFGKIIAYRELVGDKIEQDIRYPRDRKGRIIAIDYPGDHSDSTYKWECGQLKRVIANGGYITIDYSYDSRGRLTAMKHNLHGDYRYRYNDLNQIIATGHRKADADPWAVTRYEYDNRGQRIAEKTDAGETRKIYRADGTYLGHIAPDGTREIRYFDAKRRGIATVNGESIMFVYYKSTDSVEIRNILSGSDARAQLDRWRLANPSLAKASEEHFPNPKHESEDTIR